MTKRNLIITIILLLFIDLIAAAWYMSRRIETGGNSQNLFGQRDTTEAVIEADTDGIYFQMPDAAPEAEFDAALKDAEWAVENGRPPMFQEELPL